MDKQKISFRISTRSEAITFHLGVPTMREDNQYLQRFVGLSEKQDDTLAASEYEIFVDSLAAWAVDMPELETLEKNGSDEPTKQPLGEGTPAEAIKAYFRDRNASNEWLATYAVSAFRGAILPSVTFLEASR